MTDLVSPNVLPFEGRLPVLGRGTFVAPGAMVIGDVECGDDCSFWYNTVVRGDVMPIRFGDRVNVQDLSVVHVTSVRFPTTVGDDVTIGHRAIVHGCTVEDGCLIGMGAIILDGAIIGRGSLVGAGALVTPGTVIPPGSMVFGAPAKVVRALNPDELANLRESAANYVSTARRHAESLRRTCT